MAKTVSIEAMIQVVNNRNAKSTVSAEMRTGWNCLLESILHDAGVYAGYGYLPAENVPAGQLPGVVRCADGSKASEFPDESRREYYLHRKLRK